MLNCFRLSTFHRDKNPMREGGFRERPRGAKVGIPQKKFADKLSTCGKMASSDYKRKKSESAEIYDGAMIPNTQSYNRLPGSRGSNQWPHIEKGIGKAKGAGDSRYTRGG